MQLEKAWTGEGRDLAVTGDKDIDFKLSTASSFKDFFVPVTEISEIKLTVIDKIY